MCATHNSLTREPVCRCAARLRGALEREAPVSPMAGWFGVRVDFDSMKAFVELAAGPTRKQLIADVIAAAQRDGVELELIEEQVGKHLPGSDGKLQSQDARDL
jgi:hypothetical protein